MNLDELDAACRPEALKSLRAFYGASDRQKKKHDNTVKSMACPGTRPQEICTPLWLLERYVLPLWGHIELDPCACVQLGTVPAKVRYYGPPRDAGGLVLPWLDRTYCNPPYKDLKAWLARAQDEALRGLRIVVLAPVRTHRAWFRDALCKADRVRWLDPVKFEGYDQAFPAPLCLLGWGLS